MATTQPVRVDADLAPDPSRWLWLVKWLLLIPHYVVLAFLWVGFVAVSVAAFVAILVTGRSSSLHDVPDYPAHLTIDYPDHLSRGLVLVKWWLLALPHYLIVSVFVGGAGYAVADDGRSVATGVGLIDLLVLVAGVTLLVGRAYPQRLFALVMGLDRWVLRVAAYAALMTDQYPPFALDQGGHEGAATPSTPWKGPGAPVAAPA